MRKMDFAVYERILRNAFEKWTCQVTDFGGLGDGFWMRDVTDLGRVGVGNWRTRRSRILEAAHGRRRGVVPGMSVGFALLCVRPTPRCAAVAVTVRAWRFRSAQRPELLASKARR